MPQPLRQTVAGTTQELVQENMQNPAEWNVLLLRVAQKRDREAFQLIFEHFAPLVKAYAYKVSRLAHAEALAEELAQETMIKVWKKSQSFNPDKSAAGTWIFTIARNTRIDLLRKNARHLDDSNDEYDDTVLEADDIWEEEGDATYRQIEQNDLNLKIMASINELPDEQLSVIKTIYLDGLSHSEAASLLRLPLGTVKSRVRLALQKLKLTIDI